MKYYGVSDTEIKAYEKEITIGTVAIETRIYGTIYEYWGVFEDGFEILLTRAIGETEEIEDILKEKAHWLYVQQKLDKHFMPISENLKNYATKLDILEMNIMLMENLINTEYLTCLTELGM